MAYKIAVASSDGSQVDLSFDEADSFRIYEVSDGSVSLVEVREWKKPSQDEGPKELVRVCRGSRGGCDHSGRGCGGNGFPKVRFLSDCRSILCANIGFRVRKEFDKSKIAVFDIEYDTEAALEKIILYFEKVDGHQNLSQFAKEDSR